MNGYSPAELLMSRRYTVTVPMIMEKRKFEGPTSQREREKRVHENNV